MNSIKYNIKNLRKKYGISQEVLAEKLNVTRQAVSSWETGKNEPDILTLEAIAAVFSTDINEVIYGAKVNDEQNHGTKIVALTLVLLLCTFISLYFFIAVNLQISRPFTNLLPFAHGIYCLFAPLIGITLGGVLTYFTMNVFGLEIKNTSVKRGLFITFVILILAYSSVAIFDCFFFLRDVFKFGNADFLLDYYFNLILSKPYVFIALGAMLVVAVKKPANIKKQNIAIIYKVLGVLYGVLIVFLIVYSNHFQIKVDIANQGEAYEQCIVTGYSKGFAYSPRNLEPYVQEVQNTLAKVQRDLEMLYSNADAIPVTLTNLGPQQFEIKYQGKGISVGQNVEPVDITITVDARPVGRKKSAKITIIDNSPDFNYVEKRKLTKEEITAFALKNNWPLKKVNSALNEGEFQQWNITVKKSVSAMGSQVPLYAVIPCIIWVGEDKYIIAGKTDFNGEKGTLELCYRSDIKKIVFSTNIEDNYNYLKFNEHLRIYIGAYYQYEVKYHTGMYYREDLDFKERVYVDIQ